MGKFEGKRVNRFQCGLQLPNQYLLVPPVREDAP
jgi:hypothetical protein